MINEFIFLLIASINDEADSIFITEIYKNYYALMIKNALEYAKSKSDAEDIVQSVFEKLIKSNKISLLKPFNSGSLLKYIISAVRNTSINFNNSRILNPDFISLTVIDDDDETQKAKILSDTETPEKIFFDKDRKEKIYNSVKQLPEAYRIVLECKYFQDMSDKDIAAKLHIKSDSVREYLTRARKALQKILEKGYDYE